MNAEDDPEARIRALEQPLSDQARASELGGGQAGGDAAYLPPPTSPYNPPDYSTQAYGAQPYGNQPYGTQPYGTQQPYGGAPYESQQYGAQPYGTSYGAPPTEGLGRHPVVGVRSDRGRLHRRRRGRHHLS